MRGGHLRGALSRAATARQWNVLATCVAADGPVPDAAELAKIRPSAVNDISPICVRGRVLPPSS